MATLARFAASPLTWRLNLKETHMSELTCHHIDRGTAGLLRDGGQPVGREGWYILDDNHRVCSDAFPTQKTCEAALKEIEG
jgi:hypothetical protein